MMRMPIVATLLFGTIVLGCAGNHAAVAQSDSDKTEPVSEVGNIGAPKLSTAQQTELMRILKKLPPWKRKRIRFVFSGPEGGAKTSFYILDRQESTSPSGGVETYRVLNASCNTFYDPVDDYVFIGTSCGIDADVTN